MKKTIICYGDSNTYGYIPLTHARYDKNSRWSGILSNLLTDNFEVIEEGCNNRTGFYNSTDGAKQTGLVYIDTCLKEHKPADIFIFALGTNDLQKFYSFNHKDIKNGLSTYLKKIKEKSENTKILLISPVKLNNDILKGYFNFQFDENSIKKSILIQDIYKDFAAENNIDYIDINKITSPSEIDGLHYSKESHSIIANHLASYITEFAYSLN